MYSRFFHSYNLFIPSDWHLVFLQKVGLLSHKIWTSWFSTWWCSCSAYSSCQFHCVVLYLGTEFKCEFYVEQVKYFSWNCPLTNSKRCWWSWKISGKGRVDIVISSRLSKFSRPNPLHASLVKNIALSRFSTVELKPVGQSI